MEIERKYLVKTLPEHLEQYQSKKIAQGIPVYGTGGTYPPLQR